MKNLLLLMVMLLGTQLCGAQEKVMNVLKKDGTSTQTRVTELDKICFLAMECGDQGLKVKTTGGETVAVLFEANPVVTVTSGKMVIKSDNAEKVEVEVTEIEEICFGSTSDDTAIRELKGFTFVMQDGGALLRDIPQGEVPHIYTVDGRSVPTPPVRNGELLLNRASLGEGIYIVKVGAFCGKIKL